MANRFVCRDRNWITFLSLIDSTFDVIKLNESQSKTETDPVAPATDSKGAGSSSSDPAKRNGEVDPELTPKPAPHPELPLEPQALIEGLRELFERLSKEDGLKERGGHLALLQLEKRIRTRDEGQGRLPCQTRRNLRLTGYSRQSRVGHPPISDEAVLRQLC